MKILFASSEVVPFAKTGGLADVSGSLPVALKQFGHDVRVITPKYKATDAKTFHLAPVVESMDVPISNRMETCSILEGSLGDAVPVYFIKNDNYYHRDHLYGDSQGDYPDNAERFIYFSRSILEACKAMNFAPDILHCNDWQTGLAPVYLRKVYQNEPIFAQTASIYTVHNLGYQGLFWHYDMHLTGLGWDLFTPNGLEYYGKINLMKGGLLWADLISTVSQKYSEEIQTKEYGHGLEGVLQFRSADLSGIVNGVDYSIWNPETDPHLVQNYSVKNLSGKLACKKDLLKEFGLPVNESWPVLAMISRLDDQKGFDLVAEIIDTLMNMRQNLYFLVLGTGHERYHKLFSHIAEKYPKKAGVRLEFNAKLAHKIEAGADMFLMPSRYEPCGLNQIYSLKYGTVPIVRATGGLNDTVKVFQPRANKGAGQGTGIKFNAYKAENLLSAIKNGLHAYKDKNSWKALMIRGMQEDFSWSASAKEYEKLYKKAYEKVHA
ncbi:MAG: glycogen synthase GlgA [Candidatus Vecturithrix sp.]|jgi:starch synthase|nr:glycogen synthase GlgA [Candidatus Vecturithrix sp.]